MPILTRSPRSPVGPRRPLGFGLALAVVAVAAACSDAQPSAPPAQDGLVALVAGADSTTLLGWGTTGKPLPIDTPEEDATWIATGRADVLAAALRDGTTATSDPVHLGKPLAWRAVKPHDPAGNAPEGPDYFVTWDPEGGRFATLAGDVQAGDDIRVVLIDPTLGTAFEIPIDRPVVAAAPVWIDGDRLVVVTGDAAAPVATIVDTTSGELSDGPAGARMLATSADGARVATMDAQGAPVVIRDTSGWLDGDGSSIGSITPPSGTATAIAFALDASGRRLAVAWQAEDGSVTLAVHDESSNWRRVSKPAIGTARGAVVAWRR